MLRRVIVWTLIGLLICGQAGDLAFAQVVADGRTETTVTTSGSVTNVTTETIIGGTGVNSFSQFDVETGHTVNLHLPSGTSALVNLITGRTASQIEGTVNAIKGSTIGGRVYFVNPFGITVGPSGVINAGAVALMAPSQGFLFYESGGLRPLSADQVNAVLSGDIPLVPGGNISVQGTINAAGDIHLAGVNVNVPGQLVSGAVFEHEKPDFSDVVNINGVNRGKVVEFENGVVRIRATDTVTVGGTIAVHGAGDVDAGDIEIVSGNSIRLTPGAQLLAHVVPAQGAQQGGGTGQGAQQGGGTGTGDSTQEEPKVKAGSVTLKVAQSTDDKTPIVSLLSAAASIEVDSATIRAGEIALTAQVKVDNLWSVTDPVDLARETVTLAESLVFENVNVVRSTAEAQITLKGSTTLHADGKVTLSASSEASAGMFSIGGSSQNVTVADIGVVYGELQSHSTVQVGQGVSVVAEELDLSASNKATMDFSVYTVSQDRDWDMAIAVTRADVAAEATVAKGASLKVGKLLVQAVNQSAFTTGATVLSLSEGKGGVAFAYSRPQTRAVASLGADTSAESVVVDAWDIITRDRTTASTTAGTYGTLYTIQRYTEKWELNRLHALAQGVIGLMDKVRLDQRSGVTEQPRFAGAMTLTESSHEALANIAEGARVTADEVAVVAEVEHGALQVQTESSVNSPGASDPRNPDTSKGFSTAIAYGNYRQTAQAWIGAGAEVTAQRVGVGSRALVPYQITWHHIEHVGDITAKINGNLGLANGFLTGFVNSTSEAQDLSAAGSISILEFDTTSQAYVDRGATVNLVTGSSGSGGSWSVERSRAKSLGKPELLEWDAPVSISAVSDVEAVSGVGHLTLTFNALGGGSDTTAVGANYGQVNMSTTTKAYVAAGAKIAPAAETKGQLAGKVSVNAASKERLYLIVPTAGRAMGRWGIAGNFALGRLNVNTEASVDRTASVTAEALRLSAGDNIASLLIAGGLGRAQQGGFDAGIAIQEVDNRVRAFIGDNGTRGDKEYAQGTVRVHELSVDARRDGNIQTVSIAAAMSGSLNRRIENIGKKLRQERLEEGIELMEFRAADGAKKLEEAADAVQLEEESKLPEAQPASGGQQAIPQFGFGISGSVSYNDVTLTTEALLKEAHVAIVKRENQAPSQAQAGKLTLTAVSDTHVVAGSGGGWLILGGSAEAAQVALAGAAAVNEITNTVQALVTGSHVSGAPDLTLTAESSGDQVAVGIGLAVNRGMGADTTATVAGSVSVSIASNEVRAVVEDLDTSAEQSSPDGAGGGSGTGGQGSGGGSGESGGSGGGASGSGSGGSSGDGSGGGTSGSGETGSGQEAAARIGQVNVTATNRIRVQSGGGSLAAGLEGGSVGAGVSYNEVSHKTEAAIRKADLSGARGVNVEALTGTRIATGGGMASYIGQDGRGTGVGAFILTFVDSDTTAVIEDATIKNAGAVTVAAADVGALPGSDDGLFDFVGAGVRDPATLPGQSSSVTVVAGTVGVGRTNVELSFAYSEINHAVRAAVRDSEVESNGDVVVRAYSAANIFSLSAGFGSSLGKSGKFSGAGSVTVNKITTTTEAAVESQGNKTVAGKSLTVEAIDEAKGWTLAGQAAYTQESAAAVGLTIAHQEVAKHTSARVQNVTVKAMGAVSVNAASGVQLTTVSVSGQWSGGGALAGSSASAVVRNTTTAEVSWTAETAEGTGGGGSGTGPGGGDTSGSAARNTVTAGSLTVQATDGSSSLVLAGQLAYPGAGIAAGGAVTVHLLGNTAGAYVRNMTVDAGTGAVTVSAANKSTLQTVGVAGEFVGDHSGSGSVSWAEIGNTTEAELWLGKRQKVTAGSVTVRAEDASTIDSLAGAIEWTRSLNSSAGGAAVSYNKIGNKTRAALRSEDGTASVNVSGSQADVNVSAANRSTVQALSAAGESGNWAVGFAVTVARVHNETTAAVEKATLTVGKLQVTANDAADLKAGAFQLQRADRGDVGGGVAYAEVGNATRARLWNADVTAWDSVTVSASGKSSFNVSAVGLGVAAKGVLAGSAVAVTVGNTIEAVAGADAGGQLWLRPHQPGTNGQSGTGTGSPSGAGQEPEKYADMTITARDETSVGSHTGEAALGQSGSVASGAVSVNRVTNTVRARLAGTGSGSIGAGSLVVKATSVPSFEVVAVGVSITDGSSYSGSSATNFIDYRTEGLIDGGAKVVAQNDVSVSAENHNVITNLSGVGALGGVGRGVGLSISVNQIDGHTLAAIQGEGTSVTALAKGGSGVEVASGRLREEMDVDATTVVTRGLDPTWRPDVKGLVTTERVRGVSVHAVSTHGIRVVTVNAGTATGASISGTGNTTTNIVAGDTKALISGGAQVNPAGNQTGAGAEQAVSVKAGDHAYTYSLVGAATGAVKGIGVAVLVNAFSRGVEAGISGSQDVGAQKAVTVDAQATQGVSAVAVGVDVGIGGFAVAATVNVATFTGNTQAYIANSRVKTGAVTVDANQVNRLSYVTPSVGVDLEGGGGGAGAVSVGVMTGKTAAYVTGSTLEASGRVAVTAASRSEVDNLSISVAGAPAAAVAANVAVVAVARRTEAYLEESRVASADRRAGSVSVTASDVTNVDNRAGMGAASTGKVGFGAAAVVSSIRNNTSARITGGAVYSSGEVTVEAKGTHKVDALGAGGVVAPGTVAIGGVAVVTLIGRHISAEDRSGMMGELAAGGSGTLGLVEAVSSGERLAPGQGGAGNGFGVNEDERQAINNQTQASVVEHITGGVPPTGTAAVVASGAVLDAQGEVRVTAEEKVEAKTVAGDGDLGTLSIGGAGSAARVTLNARTTVDGDVRLTGKKVKLEAIASGADPGKPAVDVQAYQGNLGVVTLGAAVADADVSSNATVEVGAGAVLKATQEGVSVSATDSVDVNSRAMGFLGATGALGVVVALADKGGIAGARVGGSDAGAAATTVTATDNAIQIIAQRGGSVTTLAVAGVAGTLGLDAAWSEAKDSGSVLAVAGHNVTLDAGSGTVKVEGVAIPQVEATATGPGIAILGQVGAARAKATAAPQVQAAIGAGSSVNAGGLEMKAYAGDEEGGSKPMASSLAVAVGGGAGLAVDASVSDVETDVTVQAVLGASLNVAGDVNIIGGYRAVQRASGSGVAASLVAAFGYNKATTDHTSRLTITVADSVSGTVSGALKVDAAGHSDSQAQSVAGAGGFGAGAAAKADTYTNAQTQVEIGSADGLRAGELSVSAAHTTRFNGLVDSTQAAAFGGSGAHADNRVTSVVQATVRDGAQLEAGGVDIRAYNETAKPSGFSATGGAGGLANYSAVKSASEIAHQTRAALGQKAVIKVTGGDQMAKVAAINNIDVYDRASLDTGLGIEIAKTESIIDVTRSEAEVHVGAGAQVQSAGGIGLAAGGDILVSTSASSRTYGAAGAAQGASRSTINATKMVRIDKGASLDARGDIAVYAGEDLDDRESTVRAVARTDLYNKTMFPIQTRPDADAAVNYVYRIDVAENAKLKAAGNISLLAKAGTIIADGKGQGTDAYRELMAEIANAFASLFRAGEVSLSIKGGNSQVTGRSIVTVDGTVETGSRARISLYVDANGKVTHTDEAISYEIHEEDLIAHYVNRLKDLVELRQRYYDDVGQRLSLEAEIHLLVQELEDLGYTLQVNYDTGAVTVSGGASQLPVKFITVYDAIAQSGGDIVVTADHFGGTGTLSVLNQPYIDVRNDSSMFLRVKNLQVAGRVGHVYYNRAIVSSAADIEDLNIDVAGGAKVNLTIVPDTETSRISIVNTYRPIDGSPAPFIEIVGDVVHEIPGGRIRIDAGKGSIHVTGGQKISASEVEMHAEGDILHSYSPGFTKVGGDPRTLWLGQYENSNELRRSTQSVIAAGQRVVVSGRYLVLNGTIQSGRADWELVIPSTAADTVKRLRTEWENAGKPNLTPEELAKEKYTVALSKDGAWRAYYDPRLNQVVLEPVHVRGGYVELIGQILNPNPSGTSIKVMDGFGKITVKSELDVEYEPGVVEHVALALNTLDTGNVAGVVRITDLGRVNGDGTPLTTVYKRQNGQVIVEQWYGQQLVSSSKADGRTASYNPLPGTRYVWEQVVGGNAWERMEDWWPIPPGRPNPITYITFTRTGNAQLNPDYERVEVVQGNHPVYEVELSQVERTGPKKLEFSAFEIDIPGWPEEYSRYIQEYSYPARGRYTSSLKADWPVAIEFIGYDPKDTDVMISVSNRGDIVLLGDIQHLGPGQVQLTSSHGRILQPDDAHGAIRAGGNLFLNADGDIGTAATPINVDLRGTGQLSAESKYGNVHLSSPNGGLRLGDVWALKNVSMEATGSIVSTGTIWGKRVDLRSDTGGIDVKVLVAGSLDSGLTAIAMGDIRIVQDAGHLGVNRVESLAGDVYLEARQGSIYDPNPRGPQDDRMIEELERLWDELNLIGEDAEESHKMTLQAYVNLKRAEYLRYWSLRGVQPEFDEQGRVIGYIPNEYDEATASDELRALHEKYGDTEYDPAWTYVPTQEEREMYTAGGAWTREELTTGLSRAVLFKEIGSTETVVREPNVIGRNVTLLAGSIGLPGGYLDILADPDYLKNHPEARQALLAADASDIEFVDGGRKIRIWYNSPFNVQVTGELEARATEGVLYLGSRTPLVIGLVQADADEVYFRDHELLPLRIYANAGLYGSTTRPAGQPHIVGSRVLLEGGDGPIGTADNPLRVRITSNRGLAARANGDIFITSLQDLHVAEMYSRGNIWLASEGAILDARGQRPLTIEATGIQLQAKGTVGTHDKPLEVAVLGGRLEAEATDVFVSSSSGRWPSLAVGSVVARGADGKGGQVLLKTGGVLLLQEGYISGSRVELAADGKGMSASDLGAIVQSLDNYIQATALIIRSSGGVYMPTFANQVERLSVVNADRGQVLIYNTVPVLTVETVSQAPGYRLWVYNYGDDIKLETQDPRYALYRDERLRMTTLTTQTLGLGSGQTPLSQTPVNPVQSRHDDTLASALQAWVPGGQGDPVTLIGILPGDEPAAADEVDEEEEDEEVEEAEEAEVEDGEEEALD